MLSRPSVPHVLFVDNDAERCAEVLALLQDTLDYVVEVASSAEEALDALKRAEHPYSVAVITDLDIHEALVRSGVGSPSTEVVMVGNPEKFPRSHSASPMTRNDVRRLAAWIDTLVDRRLQKNHVSARIRALRQISDRLTAVENRGQLLETIAREALGFLGGKGAGVYEYHPQGAQVVVTADTEKPERVGITLRVGEGMVGRLIQEGRDFLIVHDYSNWPHRSPVYGEGSSFGAVVEVPLRWHDRILGALYVHDVVGRRFSEPEAEWLGLLADMAAIALTNAEFRAREQKKLERQLALLLRAGNIVARASNLDDGLSEVSQLLVSLFPNAFCRILLSQDDKSFLRVAATCQSRGGDLSLGLGSQLLLRDWPGLAETLAKAAPVILEATTPHGATLLERLSEVLSLDPPIRSLLVVPITLDGEVLGLLEFGDLDGDASTSFQSGEVEVVSGIAQSVARFIHRIQLYEAVKRRSDLLEALDEQSRHMRGEKQTSKLLQEVVRLAAELLNCQFGVLYENLPYLGCLELKMFWGTEQGVLLSRILHREGIIGTVAISGEAATIHASQQPELGFATAAAVPLKYAGGVADAVLFVARHNPGARITAADLDILQRFALQASLAVQTSRLLDREQHYLGHLAILHKVSDYIQHSTASLDKALHVVLTGITAGYGLGFNRAMLLLRRGERLVGRIGIGQVEESAARQGWKQDQRRGLSDFQHYLDLLDGGGVGTTEIGGLTPGLELPLADAGAVEEVLRNRQALRIEPDQLQRLPTTLLECLAPTSTVVLVPLAARGNAIGLLIADNKFTNAPITDEDINHLFAFADATAIAVDNVNLLHDTEVARDKLRSSFQASNALVSSTQPQEVLEQIVRGAPAVADAAWIRVIIIDGMGRVRDQLIAGTPIALNAPTEVRPEGHSMQVMTTRQPLVIPDTLSAGSEVSPFLLSSGVRAALCLPLVSHDGPIGVMWFNYDAPRTFADFEIESLHLYSNQSAMAYDRAREMDDLTRLYGAAHAMSGATDISHLLEIVVSEARRVFYADFATIWGYDSERNEFLPDEMTASGMSADAIRRLKEIGPLPKGTTFTVLERDSVSVRDLADVAHDFLRPEMRDFLSSVGIRSFEGSTLRVGPEPVGVLYVSYREPRAMSDRERRRLSSFARYASLSLQNARLVHQLRRTNRTAELVAHVTALEDRARTLTEIAAGTREAVGCDAVVLYAYDPTRGRWRYPPSHVNVGKPEEAWPDDHVPPTSIVYEISGRDEPLIEDRIGPESILGRGRFAAQEMIQSCVAAPLKAAGRLVGVMFLNYRRLTKFSNDQISVMKLFFNQAAVAIRNLQLFEELDRELATQHALATLSRRLLECTSLADTLRISAAVAAESLAVETCRIILRDNQGQLVVAASNTTTDVMGQRLPPRSQSRYTIAHAKCVQVDDYATEDRFDLSELEHGLKPKAGMSVPIPDRGAILVCSQSPRYFSTIEGKLLDLIAGETVLAIDRANQQEESERKSAQLRALHIAGKAISASFGTAMTHELDFELSKVLDHIVLQAVHCVASRGRERPVLGTLHLMTASGDALVVASVHPPEAHPSVIVGERLLLAGGRGITLRAAIEKAPQLVPDVAKDPGYVEFSPLTRSELAVPLLDGNHVIGVLNVESGDVSAFNEYDQATLGAFAELAVIGIQNARRYEELHETKGLVGARTAVAWMGMASSLWRHRVSELTKEILAKIEIVMPADGGKAGPVLSREIAESFARIRKYATEIDEQPIAPPLSKDLVAQIYVRRFVAELLVKFGKAHRKLSFEGGCDIAGEPAILAAPYWLTAAVTVLVDNSVREVSSLDASRWRITIRARQGDPETIGIEVRDQGRGIPRRVREQLLRSRIEETVGLGMGLITAQAIVEAYGGKLKFEKVESGASVVLWFPIAPPPPRPTEGSPS